MKFKNIIILMTAALFFVLGFLFSYKGIDEKKYLDVIEVNDVVKTAEKGNYEESLSKAYSYGMKILIIENDGEVKAKSEDFTVTSINDAIKNRDIIVDLKSGEEIKGKVIFDNDDYEEYKELRNRFFYISVSSIVGFFIVVLCVCIYLNKRIILPFEKLKKFAMSIALGNLDMELEMDKHNIFGAFTESFDIMREELKKARENERKAAESKKQLVASLSHDIKTPLASIKAVNELMSVIEKDEKQQKNISIIGRKVSQIDVLINNLFNSALEELTELKVKVTEEESLMFNELISNSDYKGKVSIIDIKPCIVKCDLLRMQQIFDNVISNSYKYADTYIEITSEVIEDKLLVSIKDFGQGVEEEELPLILRKFYRGANAASKEGAGIGLYVSKYFIESMGGKLEISNLDDGFIVKLYILIA